MPLLGSPVVRYYFDEAASGTTPTQINDSSGNAYHLTEVNYGSSTMAFNEVSGNRGLESTDVGGTHRARRAIDNTADAVRTALAGAAAVTFELVVDIQAGNSNTGRIFVINNRAGGASVVGALATNTSLVMNWNGSSLAGQALPGAGRHVIHLVVDTTAGSGEQYNVYIDGVNVLSGSATGTLSIPSNVDLIAFNRENSGAFARSFDGLLFYAAIYSSALSEADIANNVTVLADDDTPVGGPAEITGTGAATAPAAATAGAGVVGRSGSGAVTATLPTVSGAGVTGRNGTGAVTATLPTVSGAGVTGRNGTGAIAAPLPTVAGSGSVNGTPGEVLGSGNPTPTPATAAGAARRGSKDVPGSIDLSASVPTVSGSGTVSQAENFTGSGAFASLPPTVAGTAQLRHTSASALTPAAATVAGVGVLRHTASGALTVSKSTVAGTNVLGAGGGKHRIGLGTGL